MLWFKFWRESRTRFCLSAATVAVLCAAFVLLHRAASAGIELRQLAYAEFIWRITYKGYLREMFVLLTLILGLGGLLRERALGTTALTLALPVTPARLVVVRAVVGLGEVVVLALLPALLIPALSPLVGQHYPLAQAMTFGLLWVVGGSVCFAIGFLASVLCGGEYTAPIGAIALLLVYSAIADIPLLDRHFADIHDVMSGAGMPYFDGTSFAMTGPLPWTALVAFIVAVAAVVVLSAAVARAQDY